MREELVSHGFEVVTVASDGKGAEAARRWLEAANPTHPSLIDADFSVAQLYDVRNVPAAFWIDESGVIVRANDPIYAKRPTPDGQGARNEAYLDALRDWVAHGNKSRYLQDAAKIEARRGQTTFADVEAAATFKLGVYLARKGQADSARQHFQRASELSGANWTYRRQASNFLGADRETIMAGIRDPNAPAFYPPLDLGPEQD
jgi:AhpC/TSA family